MLKMLTKQPNTIVTVAETLNCDEREPIGSLSPGGQSSHRLAFHMPARAFMPARARDNSYERSLALFVFLISGILKSNGLL